MILKRENEKTVKGTENFWGGEYKGCRVKVFGDTVNGYTVQMVSEDGKAGADTDFDGLSFNTVEEAHDYAINDIDRYLLRLPVR